MLSQTEMCQLRNEGGLNGTNDMECLSPHIFFMVSSLEGLYAHFN